MKLVLVLMQIRQDHSGGAGGENGKWGELMTRLGDSSDFRRHPLLWEGQELAHLEGTQTMGKLKAYGEYLDGVWEQLREFALPLLPSLGEGAATKEAFLWAFGALKTNALRPFSQPQSLRIAPFLQVSSFSTSSLPPAS